MEIEKQDRTPIGLRLLLALFAAVSASNLATKMFDLEEHLLIWDNFATSSGFSPFSFTPVLYCFVLPLIFGAYAGWHAMSRPVTYRVEIWRLIVIAMIIASILVGIIWG